MSIPIYLTLHVDDFDAAIDFYVNKLGAFKIYQNNRFDDPDPHPSLVVSLIYLYQQRPLLVLQLKFPKDAAESALVGKQGGSRTLFSLPTADLDKLKNQMEQRNNWTIKVFEAPWMESFEVADPFGNRIQFHDMSESMFSEDQWE